MRMIPNNSWAPGEKHDTPDASIQHVKWVVWQLVHWYVASGMNEPQIGLGAKA